MNKESSCAPRNLISDTKAGTYSTADLALSTFLQARGHEILRVGSDRGRGIFTFAESAELRSDLLRWANDEPVSICVRGLFNSLRDLKGLVAHD